MKSIRSLGRFGLEILFGMLALLCLGMFMLLKGSGPSSLSEDMNIYQPLPTPGSNLQALDLNAEVKIPPSAKEIYGLVSGFRELDTWIRFELPAADLLVFMQSTHCEMPLSQVDAQKYPPGKLDPDWWRPHKAAHLESCTGSTEHLYQRIFVDLSDANQPIVYVFSATH